MKKLLFIFLFFPLIHSSAEDWELKILTSRDGSHAFFHRIIVEVLKEAGDTVLLIPVEFSGNERYMNGANESETPLLPDLVWGYPEQNVSNFWVPVKTGLTSGFGGMVTVIAPEVDLESWRGVRSLSDMRVLLREALLTSDSPWLEFWKKLSMPYRVMNIQSAGMGPGTYKIKTLMALSLERDRSSLPSGEIPFVIQLATDYSLFMHPRLSQDFKERFTRNFERGWMELNRNGRLAYLLKIYFLPIFRDMGYETRPRLVFPNP